MRIKVGLNKQGAVTHSSAEGSAMASPILDSYRNRQAQYDQPSIFIKPLIDINN